MTETGNLPLKRSRGRLTVKILAVLAALATILLCIAAWRAGLFTSQEKLNAFLTNLGAWGPLMFILIQIVQIIIPIIPGAVTCSVGVLVFGPVPGFFYNYAGIVVGSFLAFLLARRYGTALIEALVPKQTYEKYTGWLDKGQQRFDKLFALAVFLPCAPDDLLCMLAGVSKMKVTKCLVILLLCKPLFLIPYSVGMPAIKTLLAGIGIL